MIPPFAANGSLPPGIHWATWEEIVARYGANPHRRRLLQGLGRVMDEMTRAGSLALYINGSFVTSAPRPGDFDVCWDETGVIAADIEPVLIAYASDRHDQKTIYGGEIFPCGAIADWRGVPMLDFFQMSKLTGRRKGIIAIRLGSPP